MVHSAISLEIETEICEYAPDDVVRIVTENVRWLKFSSQRFENEWRLARIRFEVIDFGLAVSRLRTRLVTGGVDAVQS